MAQRSTHEAARGAERLAGGLLAHKALLVAILFCVFAASGFAAASLGTGGGELIERSEQGRQSDSGSAESAAASFDSASSSEAKTEELYVDIDGAVASPGVYRLADGSRIADAIDAAGGLSEGADVSSLNRAQKLVDGQKVHVPIAGETPASPDADSGSGASSGQTSALVNINTASVEELQSLSGVGPSTAQAIVDDRTQNGAFSSIEDLMRVSGIGEKKFEKLRSQVCV